MHGVKSKGMITNGGMPQASKVGPIAFIIKINDLSSLQNEGDGHDGWIIIFNVYGLKFVTSRVYWKLQRQCGLKIVNVYAIRHHKSGRTVASVRKIEKMWCLQASSNIFLLCDNYIRTRYSAMARKTYTNKKHGTIERTQERVPRIIYHGLGHIY